MYFSLKMDNFFNYLEDFQLPLHFILALKDLLFGKTVEILS